MEKERKSLDNKQFLDLRQATEKIAQRLAKRLESHLTVLRSLFIPRKLFGTYVKSSAMEEVPGADKAFAELQEQYAAVCEEPFGLSKKLQPPLPAISNLLEGTPFIYTLHLKDATGKDARITSPTRWVLSYRGECPLKRLRAMVDGTETRQPEEMRQTIIDHLAMVVFLKNSPALIQLLQDLNYEVEVLELVELGGLPVMLLKAPLRTFLPPDDFILQITQLSGIPAFQEIIDLDSVEKIPDPLKESLKKCIG